MQEAAEETTMKKSVWRSAGLFFTRLLRPNADKSPAEQALLQAKREKRFGTHEEEHYLGREMVARWKAHRLWG
jgi:hypothetical protein